MNRKKKMWRSVVQPGTEMPDDARTHKNLLIVVGRHVVRYSYRW